jgi:thioredoxin-related protein
VEFPHIEKLVDKYGSRGFVVVTMNVLPADDATAKSMMDRRGYKFTNLTTPDDDWASKNYQLHGTPTTILLDAGGKVILRHSGYTPEGIWALDQAISHLVEDANARK